jgi:hypothetical protein
MTVQPCHSFGDPLPSAMTPSDLFGGAPAQRQRASPGRHAYFSSG